MTDRKISNRLVEYRKYLDGKIEELGEFIDLKPSGLSDELYAQRRLQAIEDRKGYYFAKNTLDSHFPEFNR